MNNCSARSTLANYVFSRNMKAAFGDSRFVYVGKHGPFAIKAAITTNQGLRLGKRALKALQQTHRYYSCLLE